LRPTKTANKLSTVLLLCGLINRNSQEALRKGVSLDLLPIAPITKTNLLTDDAGFSLSTKQRKNVYYILTLRHCQGRRCECNRHSWQIKAKV
jgi:hypothetical protein